MIEVDFSMVDSIKNCYTCKEEKRRSEFSPNKANKDGLQGSCKACTNAKKRKIRNPIIMKGVKICIKCGLELDVLKFNIDRRAKDGRRPRCKKCISEDNREYGLSLNYISVTEGTKVCRRCGLEKSILKFYRCKNNKDGRLHWCNQCRLEHNQNYLSDPEVRKKRNDYVNNRNKRLKQEDICFKLACLIRQRLYHSISTDQKVGSAVRDLGCDISFLKEYLKSNFYQHSVTGESMTWDTWGRGYGKWQIDHIIPLSSVDLKNREQFLKVSHYTNLRPLWYEDHCEKGLNSAWVGGI